MNRAALIAYRDQWLAQHDDEDAGYRTLVWAVDQVFDLEVFLLWLAVRARNATPGTDEYLQDMEAYYAQGCLDLTPSWGEKYTRFCRFVSWEREFNDAPPVLEDACRELIRLHRHCSELRPRLFAARDETETNQLLRSYGR